MTSQMCGTVNRHLLECSLVYKDYWDRLTLPQKWGKDNNIRQLYT
jgi:hypothetical protein